ncbi:HIT domain-containing protein [Streptomyces ipomoeae]|uniref:HIT domain-containing protein n=1 Tax=Streptomyces ipomoeae TaxID=103232 RepID=A0AAE9AZG3_9ACTN|nr:HIT domain-containing protein [Streptomyces ipomoeae]TQE32621.1 HIT domain-containing protein [Streptomyces ipomoeae]
MTTAVVAPSKVSDFYCHQAIPGLVEFERVMETDRVLAFHHTKPSHPVHIVVVPKEHIPSLVDLGDGGPELLAEVMDVVAKVADQVREKHGAASVTTNVGLYQESKHLHWHVYHRGETEEQILKMYGHGDN